VGKRHRRIAVMTDPERNNDEEDDEKELRESVELARSQGFVLTEFDDDEEDEDDPENYEEVIPDGDEEQVLQATIDSICERSNGRTA
jgi:hypothetical protein